MAKAYCPECKKMLLEVLSSFECLSTWDKTEDYYAPGDECKLVKRCPDCGTLAKDREAKIERQPIQKTDMVNMKPPKFRKKGKTRSKSV
jgi:hypothetical protein